MNRHCWKTLILILPVLLLTQQQGLARHFLTLSFGVYTSDKPTVMYQKFKPILSYLEKHVGDDLGKRVRVKLKIYSTYEDAIGALVSGEVDFVRFGPASYVIAKERNRGISLLAIEEQDGKRRFHGVIFCKKDSPVEVISDLKGKTFAFGDEFSTIGRYLSQAELVKKKIYWNDLTRFEYLGRHDRVVTAVLHGRFDAGAAKESTFQKYKERGLRAIIHFPNVTKPWVIRAGLSSKVTSSLRGALFSLKDPKILGNVGKKLSGFGAVKDSEYEFVRAGMKESKKFEKPPAPPKS